MRTDVLRTAIGAADPALVALDDGCRRVTYGSLGASLDEESRWLRAAGGRYGLLADNGAPWALADLALHVGGLACVPLPAGHTDAFRRGVLDDAGLDLLLTDQPAQVRRWLPDWEEAGTAPVSGLSRLRRAGERARACAWPRGTCKITYTSGSTARPKGVCLGRRALEAVACAVGGATAELAIARHLCLLPLATLLENVAGLYAPLLRGATCLLPSCEVTGISDGALGAPRLLDAIESNAPQSLILVPELLQMLVTAAERGWPVPASLRFVAVGGARVSPALLARADAAGLPVYEGYGLSECASVVCLNAPGARRAGTVGRPLPHVRVRVGTDGQVRVFGDVMLGYLGEEPRAAGTEVDTGDLGSFDEDGFLRLDGRAGQRFITSLGRNVSPEWIESELSQRLGACPVLAFGEARPYVVAVLGRPDLDDAAVERAVVDANAALPAYAQVRRWARADAPFSVGDGTLSANGRLRRCAIHARHGRLIDSLYTEATAS